MLKKILSALVLFMDRQGSTGFRRRLHHEGNLSAADSPHPIEELNEDFLNGQFFKLGNFKGFIFDMDGLVLDTEPTYFAAWQQAAATMGYPLDADDFKNLSGQNYRQVETQLKASLGQDFNLSDFKKLGTEYWRKHVREQGIAIKPGVIELLNYAEQQGIPVCLATNSWATYARHCLAIAGLTQRFPLIVTGNEVKQVKPAPDIFWEAANRMQVAISECVVFEDSHTGIVAASASGAYAVYVPSTFPLNPLTVKLSDCMLDDLTQVFETLPTQAPFGI
jgi:beta-phosphoglucomutase